MRAGPFDAPLTGLVLKPNEVFMVDREVLGMDGRVYLCLADGCGWVFDDTKLMPQDPSVVRCAYTPQTAGMYQPPHPAPLHAAPDISLFRPPQLSVHTMHKSLRSSMPPFAEPLACTSFGMTQTMVGISGPANTLATPSGFVASPPAVSSFQVAYVGGIHLLMSPSMQSGGTGTWLPCNEIFSVAEEVTSSDGRVYLGLCDGRGWAFDDTALMPHDPSVKRVDVSWMSTNPHGHQTVLPWRALEENDVDKFPNGRRRLYPQPRGKRGGKRCSKNKPIAAATGTGAV